MKIVTPKSFTGFNMSIMQLFGKGPKMKVVCGECSIGFSDRIDMVDNPALVCPYCKAINQLPLVVTTGESE